jgi:hypothetical protein
MAGPLKPAVDGLTAFCRRPSGRADLLKNEKGNEFPLLASSLAPVAPDDEIRTSMNGLFTCRWVGQLTLNAPPSH